MSRIVIALFLVLLSAVSASMCEAANVYKDDFEYSIYHLNDTGINWCSSGNENQLECPVENFPHQDGEYGRDYLEYAGQLHKVGAGSAGFDFTKISCDGDELPFNAEEWCCVRDNTTNLHWEVKVDNPDNIRHKFHYFSWYNPNSSLNGGDPGSINGGTCLQGMNCDTYGYVDAINSENLCGYDDWRVPNRIEIHSITDLKFGGPAIDSEYFPHASSSGHWTSQASSHEKGDAWSISISSGRDWRIDKDISNAVRLVRGESHLSANDSDIYQGSDLCSHDVLVTTPDTAFRVQSGGNEVLHKPTSLIWSRCSLGEEWDGETCTGSPVELTWGNALMQASALENWRLPNINELVSIVENCIGFPDTPPLNRNIFPDPPSSSVWSATPSVYSGTGSAWSISYLGVVLERNKTDTSTVRLVRDLER